MKTVFSLASVILCLSLAVGCSNDTPAPPTADSAEAAPQVNGSQYLLDAEPEGSIDVIAVRDSAADGDEVVITGRIGGSANPWIDGRAAFSIVDPSLTACSDIPATRARNRGTTAVRPTSCRLQRHS